MSNDVCGGDKSVLSSCACQITQRTSRSVIHPQQHHSTTTPMKRLLLISNTIKSLDSNPQLLQQRQLSCLRRMMQLCNTSWHKKQAAFFIFSDLFLLSTSQRLQSAFSRQVTASNQHNNNNMDTIATPFVIATSPIVAHNNNNNNNTLGLLTQSNSATTNTMSQQAYWKVDSAQSSAAVSDLQVQLQYTKCPNTLAIEPVLLTTRKYRLCISLVIDLAERSISPVHPRTIKNQSPDAHDMSCANPRTTPPNLIDSRITNARFTADLRLCFASSKSEVHKREDRTSPCIEGCRHIDLQQAFIGDAVDGNSSSTAFTLSGHFEFYITANSAQYDKEKFIFELLISGVDLLSLDTAQQLAVIHSQSFLCYSKDPEARKEKRKRANSAEQQKPQKSQPTETTTDTRPAKRLKRQNSTSSLMVQPPTAQSSVTPLPHLPLLMNPHLLPAPLIHLHHHHHQPPYQRPTLVPSLLPPPLPQSSPLQKPPVRQAYAAAQQTVNMSSTPTQQHTAQQPTIEALLRQLPSASTEDLLKLQESITRVLASRLQTNHSNSTLSTQQQIRADTKTDQNCSTDNPLSPCVASLDGFFDDILSSEPILEPTAQPMAAQQQQQQQQQHTALYHSVVALVVDTKQPTASPGIVTPPPTPVSVSTPTNTLNLNFSDLFNSWDGTVNADGFFSPLSLHSPSNKLW